MRRPRLRSLAIAVLLAAGALRCSDTGGGEPTTATRIEMVDGNDQTATVGQPLPDPLVVLVTDQNGDPVEAVGVSWAAQGGGTVSTGSVETGSDGRASVTRILGPDTGEQTTTATVSGLEGSPVTFAATATDTGGGPGEAIAITTNPPVGAVDGEVFDPEVQPVVFVTNAGNPVAGAEVTVTALSGTLEGTITATTDANGTARFLDLGLRGIGSHALEFTAGEASVTSSPVDVSALPPEASSGHWGPVVAWDVVPLHMNLLPNGKILAWGKTTRPTPWACLACGTRPRARQKGSP